MDYQKIRLAFLEDQLEEVKGDEAFILSKIKETKNLLASWEEQLLDYYEGLDSLREEIAALKEVISYGS